MERLALGSERLRRLVAEQGCYSDGENRRIFEKWFSGERPRDSLVKAIEKQLDRPFGRVCDVGCGYGMHVLQGEVGSYGIEMEPYQARFAKSLGIEVFELDVFEANLADLPRVDTVLALAIIEHLDAPHVFLRRLHQLLVPGGLLVLETPRKPPFRFMERLPLAKRVYSDHDDHVGAFTESTLAFTCERAGFRELRSWTWSKPLVNRLRLPPRLTGFHPFKLLANGVVFIGEAVEDWNYGPRATRTATSSGDGYVYSGQDFPEAPRVPVDESE